MEVWVAGASTRSFGGKEAERQHQERHHRERRDTPEAQRLYSSPPISFTRGIISTVAHSARRCQHKAP